MSITMALVSGRIGCFKLGMCYELIQLMSSFFLHLKEKWTPQFAAANLKNLQPRDWGRDSPSLDRTEPNGKPIHRMELLMKVI